MLRDISKALLEQFDRTQSCATHFTCQLLGKPFAVRPTIDVILLLNDSNLAGADSKCHSFRRSTESGPK